jgi:hypothetical protein
VKPSLLTSPEATKEPLPASAMELGRLVVLVV